MKVSLLIQEFYCRRTCVLMAASARQSEFSLCFPGSQIECVLMFFSLFQSSPSLQARCFDHQEITPKSHRPTPSEVKVWRWCLVAGIRRRLSLPLAYPKMCKLAHRKCQKLGAYVWFDLFAKKKPLKGLLASFMTDKTSQNPKTRNMFLMFFLNDFLMNCIVFF